MSIFKKPDEETPKKEKKPRSSFAFVETNETDSQDAQDLNTFLGSGRGQGKKVLNPKGRPRLEDNEKKQETIMIYVNKGQKNTLQEKAKNSSLSVSKYILLKLFGVD